MRRRLFCLPYFYPEADSTVVVVTTPTEEPVQEPTPEDNKHLEIGIQVGQLQARVTELESKLQEQTLKLSDLEASQRWTREDLSSLFNEMWATRQEVTEVLEEIREEQTEEVTEEVTEQIPAIPAAAPEPQGEPEPEVSKRKGLLWFL